MTDVQRVCYLHDEEVQVRCITRQMTTQLKGARTRAGSQEVSKKPQNPTTEYVGPAGVWCWEVTRRRDGSVVHHQVITTGPRVVDPTLENMRPCKIVMLMLILAFQILKPASILRAGHEYHQSSGQLRSLIFILPLSSVLQFTDDSGYIWPNRLTYSLTSCSTLSPPVWRLQCPINLAQGK